MAINIVLASASPRREQLLRQIVDDFVCYAADIDESVLPNEQAHSLVKRLAISKAQCVYKNMKNALVIGSDTVISIDHKILGKPTNYRHFLSMMAMLSDCSHQVYTGVCVILDDKILSHVVKTTVNMGHISQESAIQYWQSGEPKDKAGGYAIQGIGGQFVKSIEGSISSVIGLPLYETKQLIESVQQA